jgi:hypothetical protein
MSNTSTPVCIPIPTLPSPPTIDLPLGGSLSAMADFSVGVPTNCTMTFNLLAQVTPVIGSLSCLLGILKVIGGLKAALGPPPDPSQIASALQQVAQCVSVALAPAVPFGKFIVDLLKLIISFLSCFIDELKSIASIQAGIDLNAAKGDPALTAALQCAQQNATTSMNNLNTGIQGLQPLISLMGALAQAASVPMTSFTIAPPPAGASLQDAILHLQSTIDTLQQIAQAIPV